MLKDYLKITPLILLIIVLPLSKSSLNMDEGLLIRLLVLLFVNLVLLVLVFKHQTINSKKTTLLTLSYFLFAIYILIRSTVADFWPDSLFYSLKIWSFFLLFYLIITSYSKAELQKYLPLLLSTLGIILSIWGAVEIIILASTDVFEIPLTTYQIKAGFGHRNLYLQVLFLTFPFIVYQSIYSTKHILRIAYTPFSILSLIILIILSNRSVWISLASSLLVIGLITFINKRSSKYTFGSCEVKKLGIFIVSGLILSLLFFNFYTKKKSVSGHALQITNPEKGSGKDRVELWKRTVNLISEKPIFGHGGNKWKVNMLKYGNDGLISKNNTTFYQRPHNDFLWITSEFGILGGFLYILILSIAMITAVMHYNSSDKSEAAFLLTIISTLTGFIIFSFFSFPHERIVQNVIIITVLAFIVKISTKEIHLYILPPKSLIIIIFVISIFVTGYITFKRAKSEMHLKQALHTRKNITAESLIELFNKIDTKFYPMDLTSTPVSWYIGLEHYNIGNNDEALLYFENAYSINPYHVHVLNNLGASLQKSGHIDESIMYFERAISINSNFDDAKYNLSTIYFNKQNYYKSLNRLFLVDNDTTQRFKQYLKIISQNILLNYGTKKEPKTDEIIIPENIDWYYNRFLIFKNHPEFYINSIFEGIDNYPDNK